MLGGCFAADREELPSVPSFIANKAAVVQGWHDPHFLKSSRGSRLQTTEIYSDLLGPDHHKFRLHLAVFDQGRYLSDEPALAKVEEHPADALAKGAHVVKGGRATRWAAPTTATAIADVMREMAVAREETFGPVATLFRFTDKEDVIEGSRYGVEEFTEIKYACIGGIA